MFLCCTSQGVDIVVKWLISLVVTSNHKCLNKIVSNKLALIIFEPGTQQQRWYSFEFGTDLFGKVDVTTDIVYSESLQQLLPTETES